MRRFIDQLDNAGLGGLLDRARGCCLAFSGEVLPPGFTPSVGRVGLEVDEAGGVCVLVDRGLDYGGTSESLAELVDRGELRFADRGGFERWVAGDLRSAFHPTATDPRADGDVDDRDLVADDVRAALVARAEGPSFGVDREDLGASIRRLVVGQDTAIDTLVNAVARHAAKQSPRGPLNLMAVGPTGVGKTAAFEALASQLSRSGQQWGFLRLDMNQYSEAHRVSELLGAPPGYLGHGTPSRFVQAVAATERTVVLFDEIDKAHASILMTLMNVMDVGRFQSPVPVAGHHEIDCRHCVFVFTTNLDSARVIQAIDASGAPTDPAAVNRVCERLLVGRGMPRELVARITGFLVFRPLAVDDRAQALGRAIVDLGAEYGVEVLRVDPSLIGRLLDHDTDPTLGMRALMHLLDRELGDTLADAARHGAVRISLIDGPCTGWQPWDDTGAG